MNKNIIVESLNQLRENSTNEITQKIGVPEVERELKRQGIQNFTYDVVERSFIFKDMNDLNTAYNVVTKIFKINCKVIKNRLSLKLVESKDINEDFDLSTLDDSGKYMFLDRMRSDCDYIINNNLGKSGFKNLWAGSPEKQIKSMKYLYNSVKEKPDWISMEDINNYEKQLLNIDECITEGTHFDHYEQKVKDAGYTQDQINSVISIADEYEKDAEKGFITADQMDYISDLMDLDKLSDSQLAKAWNMYYDILSMESFRDDNIDNYRKYEDAASAFAEVINREARKRKATGKYNPDMDESLKESKKNKPIIKKSDLMNEYKYYFTYQAGNSTWGGDFLKYANQNNAIKIYYKYKSPYGHGSYMYLCKSPEDFENLKQIAKDKLVMYFPNNEVDKLTDEDWKDMYNIYVCPYQGENIKVEDDINLTESAVPANLANCNEDLTRDKYDLLIRSGISKREIFNWANQHCYDLEKINDILNDNPENTPWYSILNRNIVEATEKDYKYTVELYKHHNFDPERFRFDNYNSAYNFAKQELKKYPYDDIIITMPLANGPSVINSYSKGDGWYK